MKIENKVDVVIPVYNAKDATKKCIESIFTHAGHKIYRVYVHDDNSDTDTREMLDSLEFPNLFIYHNKQNHGYGYGVNHGVSQTSTKLVLILNSDTVAVNDFISPLIEVFEKNENIAALNVGGEAFSSKDFDKFDKSAGYVKSYSLSGYAFLVRRSAFDMVKGFDPLFGRGYFEDADIARRFINSGWVLGIHPDTYLEHEHQGSFKNIIKLSELYESNKLKYFDRYPEAHKNIMLFSTNTAWADLPEKMLELLNSTLKSGSKIYWISKNTKLKLPCIDVKPFNKGLRRIVRLMNMGKRNKYKEIDAVYFAPDVNGFVLKLYSYLAKKRNINVKTFC